MATLLQEIQAACAPEVISAGNYHTIAAAVNAARTPVTSTRMISERGILESYPDGPVAADAVLSKLEAFSVTANPMASIVKRALKFLAQPEGLDIGSAATQSMLTQLAAGGVITADEATKLKSLAPSAVATVTWEQCYQAIAGV